MHTKFFIALMVSSRPMCLSISLLSLCSCIYAKNELRFVMNKFSMPTSQMKKNRVKLHTKIFVLHLFYLDFDGIMFAIIKYSFSLLVSCFFMSLTCFILSKCFWNNFIEHAFLFLLSVDVCVCMCVAIGSVDADQKVRVAAPVAFNASFAKRKIDKRDQIRTVISLLFTHKKSRKKNCETSTRKKHMNKSKTNRKAEIVHFISVMQFVPIEWSNFTTSCSCFSVFFSISLDFSLLVSFVPE